MLSKEEKLEMLEDARSEARRDHFRFAGRKVSNLSSFDEYLVFLNSVQKIFAPFNISRHPTVTRLNKL